MGRISEHAKRSPSGMYIWEKCEAQIRLCAGLESVQSEAAARGTFVHHWGEMFLAYHLLGVKKPEFSTNAFQKLDDEAKATIMKYFETVEADLEPGDALLLEQKVPSAYPDGDGTSDAILWKPKKRHLITYDLKNGTHPVDAEENHQLLTYALGGFLKYSFPLLTGENVIVQPNSRTKSKPIRRWKYDAMELLDFEGYYIERAKATENPNAPTCIGDHCYFCPARTKTCPAHREKKEEKARAAFDSIDELTGFDPFS